MASKEYLVQPEMYGKRKADYKKGESINKKWKPISDKEANKIAPNGTCSNVGHDMFVSRKTKKVGFLKNNTERNKNTQAYFYESISAALALYRTICMIANPIVETEGAEGYKVPWSIKLLHVETNQILGISEWKGAFNVWTVFHNVSDMPENFKNDMVEFLNLMLSDKSPHPYDDCTAGAVA